MTYHLGSMQWIQDYDAVDVDDELLAASAESAGLRVARQINDTATWIELRHQ